MTKTIINPRDTASFDVDAQNTFSPVCPNELPVPDALAIVGPLNTQAKFARLRLGSKDAHSAHALWVATKEEPIGSQIFGANMDVRWPRHAEPGTLGFELLAGLPPISAYDYFIWKGMEPDMHPYGACFHDFAEKLSTGAIEFLRAANINTVLVGGLATEYCVKTTAMQLKRANFRVILNLSACRGLLRADIQSACSAMQADGIIVIPDTSALEVINDN